MKSEEFEGLKFATLPVQARKANAPTIKVGVRAGGIKISCNAEAFEKLGSPAAVSVQAATKDDGETHFFLLQGASAETGWPLHKLAKAGRKTSAFCTVSAHPFKIDVVHPAVEVEADWAGDTVVLKLPNWARMNDELEAANGDGGDDGE